jgi:hypothetical protein
MSKHITIRTTDGDTIDAVDRGDAQLSENGEAHAEALAAELLEAAGRPLPEHLRRSGRPSLHGGTGRSPQVAFRLPAQTRARAEALARARGITVSQLAREALEREIAS